MKLTYHLNLYIILVPFIHFLQCNFSMIDEMNVAVLLFIFPLIAGLYYIIISYS